MSWARRAAVLVSLLVTLTGCSYRAILAAAHDAGRPSADGGAAWHDGGSDAGPDAEPAAASDAARAADGGHADAQPVGVSDAGGATGPDAATDAGSDAAQAPSVEPAYANAPLWNDYVLASNRSQACPASPAEYGTCIHGGQFRKVVLPDESSCANVTADDELGWFDWSCAAGASGIELRSSALRANVKLADLIDASTAAWQSSSVTIRRSGVTLAQTAHMAFWSNPVRAVAAALSSGVDDLGIASAVYVVNAAPTHDLRITADKVSLLVAASTKLSSGGPSVNPLLEAQARSYLWIEASAGLDVSQHASGALLDLTTSVINGLHTFRSGADTSTGVDIDVQATTSLLADLASQDAAYTGVRVTTDRCELQGLRVVHAGNTCADLSLLITRAYDTTVSGCGGAGVLLHDTAIALMLRTHASSAAGNGVLMQNVTHSWFDDVIVANSGAIGMLVTETSAMLASENDVLLHVLSTNNYGAGVVVRGRNQRVLLATAANNYGDGVRLEGPNALLMHVSAVQNGDNGVVAGSGTNDATFTDVVAANNAVGLRIGAGAARVHVQDVFATENTRDLLVEGDQNLFTGSALVSGSGSCTVAAGLVAPGLTDTPGCAKSNASTVTFTLSQSVVDAFVGQVLAPEGVNPQLLDGSGNAAADAITDWLSFAHPLRHWGKSGVIPDAALRDRCKPGVPCAIWDWRVRATSVLADPLGTPNAQVLEDTAHVLQHAWLTENSTQCAQISGAVWGAGQCRTTCLDYAYQAITQYADDGLCEPDDTCILARNRGSYAGEGALEMLGVGAASGGVPVSGFGTIYLQRFVTNGQ